MCGIVGVVGRQEPGWLGAMNACIAHRGPDDSGEYRDPERDVALAVRRLSILDLETGSQPMSDGGWLWIVHNGEIYNSPELRADLERRGVVFRTRNSDTEVLLRLYALKGEAMLDDLNGMFAFVIYDRARGRLFGARDRVGIKPLYYVERAGVFAFASELKAILRLPFMTREVDYASLFHYLSLRYVPGEGSIFQGIRRLPPAGAFRYDVAGRRLERRTYWDLRFVPDPSPSEAEWAGRIRAELRAAVKRWSLSDVPIACSLSGGIDSPAIVGLLRETGHRDLRTYSLGFAGRSEEALNELPLARRVAERWDTEHHELVLEPDTLLEDLVKMVWHLDEPYGGGLPSWYVFKLMARDVKVGLTGTGGDELFGNYGKWRPFERSRSASFARLYRRVFGASTEPLRALLRPVAGAVGHLPDSMVSAHRKRRLGDLPAAVEDPLRWHYFDVSYYWPDDRKRNDLLSLDLSGVPDTASYLRGIHDSTPTASPRDGIAYLDLRTQLTDEFLFMTDRFSMAHSLEARVPFLDHRFLELVASIPADLRTRRDDPKALLKQAVGDLLPDELLRTEKRGFVLPTALWLRGKLRPLAERLLSTEFLEREGIFKAPTIQRLWQEHLSGRADHSSQIWTLLMFQLWYVIFVELASSEAPAFTWRDLAASSRERAAS